MLLPLPAVRAYDNALVGTCGGWTTMNMSSNRPGNLPWQPAKVGGLVVSGSVTIRTYLSSNCTDSPNTVALPLLRILNADGSPYVNKTTFAYGFVGESFNPCTSTSVRYFVGQC